MNQLKPDEYDKQNASLIPAVLLLLLICAITSLLFFGHNIFFPAHASQAHHIATATIVVNRTPRATTIPLPRVSPGASLTPQATGTATFPATPSPVQQPTGGVLPTLPSPSPSPAAQASPTTIAPTAHATSTVLALPHTPTATSSH